MCGGEIEVSKCSASLVRPVFNVVHKDRAKWKRTKKRGEPVCNDHFTMGKYHRTAHALVVII